MFANFYAIIANGNRKILDKIKYIVYNISVLDDIFVLPPLLFT